MPRTRPLVLGAAVALLLAACSGGDSPTDPGDNGNPPGSQRVIKANPSFTADIQEIFDRAGCSASQCHGSSQEAGLDLRSGNSYADLVGVQATQAAVDRVIPNDAENSYLIVKVEGRQSVGGRMPLGGTPLDNIDITNLRNWINQGAEAN